MATTAMVTVTTMMQPWWLQQLNNVDDKTTPCHVTWYAITIKGQICPNTTSQLCCCRCCYSPLAVKKKKSSPFGVLQSWGPYLPLVHLPQQHAFDLMGRPTCSINDSTSILNYKTSHKVKPLPQPKMVLPRSRSSEEAVTNILYNTPPPSLQPYKVSPPFFSSSSLQQQQQLPLPLPYGMTTWPPPWSQP